MTKQTRWHVRPAKTQLNLGIRPVWSESSLCAQRVAKDPSFLHADNEDSAQTWRMPRLIWVFTGRTCHIVGFVVMRLTDEYSTAKPTLKRWRIGNPTAESQWTLPKAKHQEPTKLKVFKSEPSLSLMPETAKVLRNLFGFVYFPFVGADRLLSFKVSF